MKVIIYTRSWYNENNHHFNPNFNRGAFFTYRGKRAIQQTGAGHG
jgi:hypothetical protein